jgi:hypothetical protein
MRVMWSVDVRHTVAGGSTGEPRSHTINEAGDGTMRASGRGIS